LLLETADVAGVVHYVTSHVTSSLSRYHVYTTYLRGLTLNLPTTIIVAQPFNVIKWQLKFNPVA
jgi:hypothetical protein